MYAQISQREPSAAGGRQPAQPDQELRMRTSRGHTARSAWRSQITALLSSSPCRRSPIVRALRPDTAGVRPRTGRITRRSPAALHGNTGRETRPPGCCRAAAVCRRCASLPSTSTNTVLPNTQCSRLINWLTAASAERASGPEPSLLPVSGSNPPASPVPVSGRRSPHQRDASGATAG